MSYVARKKCGCMVAAAVDRPEWAKENAKAVAGWLREGLTVDRVDVETVRRELGSCVHEPRRAPAPAQLGLA